MKLQRKLLSLFIVTSCTSTPNRQKVDVCPCVIDFENDGMQCFDRRKQSYYFVDFDDADNYVCFSPEDVETLLKYR